jgi:S-(hydroxymethyl)glutathione dehydrogenase / alcohol dehydrogenase
VRSYLDGRLDLDSFVTARMPLEDVNEAFAMMERQEGIRTALTF